MPTCARTLVKCLAPIPFNGMDSYDGGTSRVGLLESADSVVAFNAGRIIHCEQIMQVDAKIRSLFLSLSLSVFIYYKQTLLQADKLRRKTT